MRVAIVGWGRQGRRIGAAVNRVAGLRLVAVSDRRPEAFLEAMPGEGVATGGDVDALLDETRPEIVAVATHAPSHAALVDAALRHGVRRILCEKPMAVSLREAKQMQSRAKEAGALLAVNHGRRHVPAYGWLRDRIASGEWGTLRAINGFCPGIGLGCLGTHFIDVMAFLSGDVFASVTAWVDPERSSNPRGTEFHDPGGLLVVEGRSGARYVHHQIEDGVGSAELEIILSGMHLRVDERSKSVLLRGSGKATPEALPTDRALDLDLVGMNAAILRNLVDGAPLTCDAGHGYRSLEIIVGAYMSVRDARRSVSLPIEDPPSIDLVLPVT